LKCREAIQEISNFLDGDLNDRLRKELERHFGECEECNLVVVQTKKMIEIFIQSEPRDLPHEVRNRLHGTLRKKLRQPSA